MCCHRRLHIQCPRGDPELEHELWGQILGEEDDDDFQECELASALKAWVRYYKRIRKKKFKNRCWGLYGNLIKSKKASYKEIIILKLILLIIFKQYEYEYS